MTITQNELFAIATTYDDETLLWRYEQATYTLPYTIRLATPRFDCPTWRVTFTYGRESLVREFDGFSYALRCITHFIDALERNGWRLDAPRAI